MESKYGIYNTSYKKTSEAHFTNGYKPFFGYFQKENDTNFYVTFNRIGLRGKLPDEGKKDNEFRIAVLGDSFIEGFGVKNDSTIPYLIESELNKHRKPVSVINAGICGSSPFYQIDLYHAKLKSYNPDLIILFTNVNDLMDAKYYLHGNMPPLYEYFFAASHIFRVFYTNVYGYNPAADMQNKRSSAESFRYSRILTAKIAEFEKELRTNNQQFLLVYLPLRDEMIGTEKKYNYTNAFNQTIYGSGIRHTDMYNEFNKYFKNDTNVMRDYYFSNDIHLNSSGNYLVAKIIAKKITEDYD